MKTSEQINELATALAKAQHEIKSASEDAVGKVRGEKANYDYKYATLASVWDACRTPLSKNGLAIAQLPEVEPGSNVVRVTTRMMHQSGQWLESVLCMSAEKTTPQSLGSAITYARRYALSAMVGVAPDDDDGADASTPASYPQREQYQPANREADRQQRPPQERNQRPPQQQQPPAQQPPSQVPAPANIEAPRPPTPNERLRALLRDEVGCKNAKEAEAVILLSIGKRCLPADLIPEDAEAAFKIITDTVSADYPYTRLLAEAMEKLSPEPAE